MLIYAESGRTKKFFFPVDNRVKYNFTNTNNITKQTKLYDNQQT